MDLTYKEIKGQYNALVETLNYMDGKRGEVRRFFSESKPKSIIFIGSGSSYYLSQSAELIAKARLGIKATSLPAGDIMINYRSYLKIFEDSLVVVISRSGSTTEIIEAIKKIRSVGDIRVIGISCTNQSELCKVSDMMLEIPWAFDESVCQTRSVTNLYTVQALLVGFWADDNKLVSDIRKVVNNGNVYINQYESKLKEIAETEWKSAVVLADGEIQGISAEAALAFIEISQIPASYHHLLDVRHGPIVMIDKDTLVIARITGNGLEYQRELLAEIARKGSRIITLSNEDCNVPDQISLNIAVDSGLDYIAGGIPFIFISQITAYYKAVQKGLNPDVPDGLDPWIKL